MSKTQCRPEEMVELFVNDTDLITIIRAEKDKPKRSATIGEKLNIFRKGKPSDFSFFASKDGIFCELSALIMFVENSPHLTIEWDTLKMRGFRIIEKTKQPHVVYLIQPLKLTSEQVAV